MRTFAMLEKAAYSVAFLPDVHLDHRYTPSSAWEVAKRFTMSMQPKIIILGGDFLDMASLCHWTRSKRQWRKREGLRYRDDIEHAQDELGDLCDRCPDAEMHYLEGNHEHWLEQYIDLYPELEDQLDLRKDLKLTDMGIPWVPVNEVLTVGKVNYIHGWYHNMYHAKKTLLVMGDHTIYGHVHEPQIHYHRIRAKQQPHKAMATGCLCDLNPDYLRGKPSRWAHGFAYVEYREDGQFQAHHIDIVDGKLTFGGYTWKA